MSNGNFIKVRKTEPCAICGKGDWCMISRDRSVALCARIEAGSFKKTKGGWCHRLTSSPAPKPVFDNLKAGFRSISRRPSSLHTPHDGLRQIDAKSDVELVQQLARSFGSQPVGNWLYQDRDDSPVMRVLRFDTSAGDNGGKQYRPLYFDASSDRWRVGDPTDRKLLPLYRLPQVVDAPIVWICEGEKCADAAVSIGLCATTSAHGAGAAERSDWSALAGQGRTIIILPDNDDAGARYASDVARLILQQSPPDQRPAIKVVNLPDLPHKGDLHDWLERRDSLEAPALRQQIEQIAQGTRTLDASEIIGGAQLVPLSSVQGREVHWLWNARIARGKITLIVGDPGIGKSFLTLDLAARVSTGATFPDGSINPAGAGKVLLISAEDDLEDTVQPRLRTAGADLSKITWLHGVRRLATDEQTGQTQSRPTQTKLVAFTLDDVTPLREALLASGSNTQLVVIDPVSAFLGDKCDGNNNAQVRALLAELSRLAAEFDCAFVLVTHLNKGNATSRSGSRGLYRAMGSLAFVAAARCAMLACRDKNDNQRKLLLPMKNNIGNDQDGLAWRIVDGALQWEDQPVEMNADDALGAMSEQLTSGSAMQTVTDWLTERLSQGPVPVTELRREAKEKGFSFTTMDRAKQAMGLFAKKSSFEQGWVWSLSDVLPEERQVGVG